MTPLFGKPGICQWQVWQVVGSQLAQVLMEIKGRTGLEAVPQKSPVCNMSMSPALQHHAIK